MSEYDAAIERGRLLLEYASLVAEQKQCSDRIDSIEAQIAQLESERYNKEDRCDEIGSRIDEIDKRLIELNEVLPPTAEELERAGQVRLFQ